MSKLRELVDVIDLPGCNPNLAAPAPVYTGGKLAPLGCDTKLFTFPQGIIIDDEMSIYVAQWNSGKAYPIKLERVKA